MYLSLTRTEAPGSTGKESGGTIRLSQPRLVRAPAEEVEGSAALQGHDRVRERHAGRWKGDVHGDEGRSPEPGGPGRDARAAGEESRRAAPRQREDEPIVIIQDGAVIEDHVGGTSPEPQLRDPAAEPDIGSTPGETSSRRNMASARSG